MVSQISNYDSDGCPVDHLGERLEDFNDVTSNPIMVGASVFQDIMNGSNNVQPNHLETDLFEGAIPRAQTTIPSALGGIPVVAEGWVSENGDSVEGVAEDSLRNSSIFKAAMSINHHDRSELAIARDRVNVLHNFISKLGYKPSDVDESLIKDGWKNAPLERDELGLPILPNLKNPNVTTGEKKSGGEARNVFVDMSDSVLKGNNANFKGSSSGAKDGRGLEKMDVDATPEKLVNSKNNVGSPKKSWS